VKGTENALDAVTNVLEGNKKYGFITSNIHKTICKIGSPKYGGFLNEVQSIISIANEFEDAKVAKLEEDKKIQSSELKKILKEAQVYKEYIDKNAIYIDKTEMIFKLLTLGECELFIARPKRFGKSLLLSTIESMYTESDTAKYFKDTWFGAHPDAWKK